ncbi:MAG: LLM class flavin-dependent oxidoreductase, partial [Candidatus Nanopelagicales bacterium]
MKIRIGVGLGVGNTLSTPAEFGRVVDQLEDLAFDSLWMSDRVTGAALDPLVALAVAAGRTRRLKLGTNVLVLPGRDPFLMARQLAAIDQLSEGRLLPAVGLGSPSRADRAPFGVAKGTRAAAFEEALSVMRALWAEGGSVPHPDAGGKASTIDPKPTRPLEVWFGGRSTPALERAGRLSDGWIGSFQTPEETGAARSVIMDAATAAGRAIDDDHFGTTLFYARTHRTEL